MKNITLCFFHQYQLLYLFLGMQEVQRDRKQHAVQRVYPIGETPCCHLQKSEIDVATKRIRKKSASFSKTFGNFAGSGDEIKHDEHDLF